MTRDYQAGVAAALAGFYERAADPRVREQLEDDRAEATRTKRKRDPRAAPTEREEQRTLVQWLRAHRIEHVAHLEGAYYGKSRAQRYRTAAVMRQMGAQRGTPDIQIVTPAPSRPEARGVWIELKRRTGGRVSPEQAATHERLRACGALVEVCCGADAAIAWLKGLGYGNG
jgi:hypothetical protein